ncbi:sensor histidine kinase [Fodinicola acaciae]|uniref:sensor histidine kinase n=1 Tax=Fodinicola acaciae TaxID=2681555 RepID=UPI0013D636B2|nr:histidine kinase [Fodinicola acaciae]
MLVWLRRHWQVLVDAAFVIAVAALFGVSGAWRPWNGWLAAGVALSALEIVPLFVRRRAPAVVLSVVTAATTAHLLMGASRTIVYVPALIAIYAAAVNGSRWVRWGLCAAAIAVIAVATTPLRGLVEGAALALVVGGVTWLMGAERRRHLVERSVFLAERTRARERELIARRLHDSLAHTITVMLIQAEAMRTSASVDRLDQLLGAGRQALDEVRETLADLHEPDVRQALDRLRKAGLVIDDVDVDGLAGRIVVEAATNALRHAGPGAVVTVRVDGERVEVRNGPGQPVDFGPTPGLGLRGLAAEVAECGGSLSYGPDGDGWLVTAFLPTDVAVVPSSGRHREVGRS